MTTLQPKSNLSYSTILIFKSIKINDIEYDIPINNDKMINASLLCKASKKQFFNYKKLKNTQDELKNISENLNISQDNLIKSTAISAWIHISLIKHFSNWISSSVGNQISEQFDKMNFDTLKKDELKYINLILKDGSNINIRIRNNNYINVTHICKISNKRLDFWKRNETNLELIKKNPLIEYEDGSFAHPDISIKIAKWCSPDFEEQFLKFFNTKEEVENNKLIKENKCNNKIIKLNNIEIISRKEDGYINLSALCKAGNKEFKHWKENKKTYAFLDILSSSVGIPTDELIKYQEGSNNEKGSYGHPQVSINVAQWISPEFDVNVSKWIYELALTGKVELGKEKTNEELENIYKEKIDKMQLSIKQFTTENVSLKKQNIHLSKLHDNILKKRNYHKFKKGKCFYIVKDDWREKEYLKFGITSNINDRLQEYRTIVPECKILFLVYLENNELLENNIKSKYNKILTHQNHEYVLNIESDKIILIIKKLLKFLNMQSTIEKNLELYNNPYDNTCDNQYDKILTEDNIDKENENIINDQYEEDCDSEHEEYKNEQDCNSEYQENEEDKDEEDFLDKEYDNYLIKEKEVIDNTCNVCNKKYKTELNLIKHQQKVHNIGIVINDENKDNKCFICNNNKCYSSKSKLKRHMDTIHNKNEEVICNLCDKKLVSKDSLNSHIKTVHNKSTSVECNLCNKIFTTNGSLEIHIKTVHNKSTSVECNLCNKIFTTKKGYDIHIKKIHEGKIQKTKCEICEKILDTKNLKYHMFSKHKI